MPDGKRFREALKRGLYPVLRGEGFVGTGTELRRQRDGAMHCFKLRSDGAAGWCHLELGAHFDFLPNAAEQHVPLSAIFELNCAFRATIIPPTGISRGFVYLDDPAEIAESVAFIVSEWHVQGHAFFTRYGPDRESLERLLDAPRFPGLLDDPRSYVRIALHLRRYERARALIDDALGKASATATILIADLIALRTLADAGARSAR